MKSIEEANVSYKPKCLGTGLLSLDLIYKDSNLPYAAAGGSCGNVMTMLTSFGWDARPACKIGSDTAGAILLHDLMNFGVNTDWVQTDNNVKTPIILEFINSQTSSTHKFSRTCHKTHKKLPRYAKLNKDQVHRLAKSVEDFDVYYFDRLDESSFTLAQMFAHLNKPVFFEPQKITNLSQFIAVLPYISILKVSEDTANDFNQLIENDRPELTIITRGKEGLSYHLKNGQTTSIEAIGHNYVVDACGSGDWLSASIINQLFFKTNISLDLISVSMLEAILFEAQRNSVNNLSFIGARGAMYNNIKPNPIEPSFTCGNGVTLKGQYLQLQSDIPPSELLA